MKFWGSLRPILCSKSLLHLALFGWLFEAQSMFGSAHMLPFELKPRTPAFICCMQTAYTSALSKAVPHPS